MHKTCAVTGSFDPVTLGHISIVEMALKRYEKVFVLMLVNPDKSYTFTVDERLELLYEAFKNYERVEVAFYDGYTADFCKAHGIDVLVRGVRNETDLAYEKELARANWEYGKIETVFFEAKEALSTVSSNLARFKIANEEPLWDLLPESVINKIKEIKKR